MQLTLYTDIGLKTLMYLKYAEGLVTLPEISKQFDLPYNHVIKVANHLVRLNWVSSVRGRNGGLRYNKDSDKLKLGDVVAILEGKTELLNCEGGGCKLRNACILRGILSQAVESFYSNLNQYTLADITGGITAKAIIKMHKEF